MLIVDNYLHKWLDSYSTNLYRIMDQLNSAQKHSIIARYSIKKEFKQSADIQYSTRP